MTLTRTQVLDLLDRHGLAPSRAMGQNFVVDPNTIDAMVRAAELTPEDAVVEIGPGLGSLTRALAAEVREVLAVEADRHLLAPLAEAADAPNIEIVHADATTPEWRTKLGPSDRRWALVANLPYNIAVPLLLDLLDNEPRIKTFTFHGAEGSGRAAGGPGGHQGLRHSHPQGGLLVRGSHRPLGARHGVLPPAPGVVGGGPAGAVAGAGR